MSSQIGRAFCLPAMRPAAILHNHQRSRTMSRFPHLAARAEQSRRAQRAEHAESFHGNDSAVRDAFLGIGIRLGIVLGLAYGIQAAIPWIAG